MSFEEGGKPFKIVMHEGYDGLNEKKFERKKQAPFAGKRESISLSQRKKMFEKASDSPDSTKSREELAPSEMELKEKLQSEVSKSVVPGFLDKVKRTWVNLDKVLSISSNTRSTLSCRQSFPAWASEVDTFTDPIFREPSLLSMKEKKKKKKKEGPWHAKTPKIKKIIANRDEGGKVAAEYDLLVPNEGIQEQIMNAMLEALDVNLLDQLSLRIQPRLVRK